MTIITRKGTGKSTFGMSLALDKGILKCISTDTLRQVKRTCDSSNIALHRSSYEGYGDPIVNWLESCEVVQICIESVIKDCIKRGVSLVLEGVHIIPDNRYINMWTKAGGVGIGAVLAVEDATTHRELIYGRGEITKRGSEHQIKDFARIRAIQAEMVRLGKLHGWELINETVTEDPYTLIWEKIDMNNPAVPSKRHPLSQKSRY